MENVIFALYKIGGAVLGMVLAAIAPTIPFAVICFMAVVIDCFSAWQLKKRISKKYPDKDIQAFFTSEGASKAFGTILRIYLIIILCYLVDVYVIDFIDIHLANIVSGAFCLLQTLSILENESSCNDAQWAKILQKVLVDKTKKYLEIDMEQIMKEVSEVKEE